MRSSSRWRRATRRRWRRRRPTPTSSWRRRRRRGRRATRIMGDANLQSAINAEAAARKQGGADTLATATKYTDAQLAAEIAARQAADAAITNNLNLETAARQAGDVALQNSINALSMQ